MMKNNFLYLPLLVFFFTLLSILNVSAQENLERIYWSALPHPTFKAEDVVELAKFGRPTRISVPAADFTRDKDEFLENLIVSECGFRSSDPYWTEFFNHTKDLNEDAENSLISTIDENERLYIDVPFCFKNREQLVIKPNDLSLIHI